MAVVQQHSYKGFVMLNKVPFLKEPAEIVYAHQENFDGTGYPRGLKGDDIPFGARVVAIANSLDSMTSDLPYRAARSHSDAQKGYPKTRGHSVRSRSR